MKQPAKKVIAAIDHNITTNFVDQSKKKDSFNEPERHSRPSIETTVTFVHTITKQILKRTFKQFGKNMVSNSVIARAVNMHENARKIELEIDQFLKVAEENLQNELALCEDQLLKNDVDIHLNYQNSKQVYNLAIDDIRHGRWLNIIRLVETVMLARDKLLFAGVWSHETVDRKNSEVKNFLVRGASQIHQKIDESKAEFQLKKIKRANASKNKSSEDPQTHEDTEQSIKAVV